jgi:hypothetical protein
MVGDFGGRWKSKQGEIAAIIVLHKEDTEGCYAAILTLIGMITLSPNIGVNSWLVENGFEYRVQSIHLDNIA